MNFPKDVGKACLAVMRKVAEGSRAHPLIDYKPPMYALDDMGWCRDEESQFSMYAGDYDRDEVLLALAMAATVAGCEHEERN